MQREYTLAVDAGCTKTAKPNIPKQNAPLCEIQLY